MRNLKKTHSSIKKKVKIAKYSILENKKLDIPPCNYFSHSPTGHTCFRRLHGSNTVHFLS